MRVYTLIRRVQRVIGRGLRGNRLMMGPYNLKREGPVILIGVAAAGSIALAGAAAAGIWPGLVISLFGASLILVITAGAVGYIRGLSDSPGLSEWPPLSVRARAQRNLLDARPDLRVGTQHHATAGRRRRRQSTGALSE